jgi:hypothetical protein
MYSSVFRIYKLLPEVKFHVFSSDNGRLLMKNVSGWTPLMYACYNDHDRIVQLLISCGVDQYDCNNAGETPLMFAALNGNEKMLELVYKVKYKLMFYRLCSGTPNEVIS